MGRDYLSSFTLLGLNGDHVAHDQGRLTARSPCPNYGICLSSPSPDPADHTLNSTINILPQTLTESSSGHLARRATGRQQNAGFDTQINYRV